jgi:hypothetical protein
MLVLFIGILLFAIHLDKVKREIVNFEFHRFTCFFFSSSSVKDWTIAVNLLQYDSPFILSLLGIDSVYCPMEKRLAVREKLASNMKPAKLNKQYRQ